MIEVSHEGPPVVRHARALLAQLQRLAAQAPLQQQPLWLRHQQQLEELAHLLEFGAGSAEPRQRSAVTRAQWGEFGQRLRDKRNAAGFSRLQLARKAKLSDATVKFLETARHPPSRATLIRLIAVPELKLTWAEVPGQPTPPARDLLEAETAAWSTPAPRGALNCFLAPSYDPLALRADWTRLLQGAGGYLEQSWIYLEPASAASYLALCQHSLAVTALRSRLPLGEVAKRIETLCGLAKLQVFALGCGDGFSETQLVEHLLQAGTPPCELCLLDLSPPLLTHAYRHAAERLGGRASVFVWGLLGNFYYLPQYTALQPPPEQRGRRLYTMLGQTWAHLDHEPRFLQQSLVDSQPDDLLLLDLPLVQGSCHDRTELRRRDSLLRQGVSPDYAQWLQEPLLRHCPQAEQVAFHWELETHAPVPGSYVLHAMATVQSSQRADRSFSVFRIGRYESAQLAQCMESLGWYEVGAWVYGGEHSLRLYRKGSRCLRAEPPSPNVAQTFDAEVR